MDLNLADSEPSCEPAEAIRQARAAFHWHLTCGTNAPMFWRILNTLGAPIPDRGQNRHPTSGPRLGGRR